jgi:dipeptidyl aminopeptidase/acylaminoacyl peptidase
MWEDARNSFSYREVDMISGMLSSRNRARAFVPFVFTVAVLAALLVGPAPGIAQQEAATQQAVASAPKVLNLEDYPRWSRIGNAGLSPDGVWMSYSYDPLEGDNTLYVRNLEDGTTHEAERASGARFSDDSSWVAYMVSPEGEEGGGRGGRGGGRGGNGGGAGREATLMNLASGETFATGEADSFTFSDDGRFFVVKRRKADREAEHDGTDLVLRDLSSGLVQNIGNVDEFAFNGDADILAYTVDAADGTGNGLYVLHLDSRMLQPLDTSSERYEQLAWSDDGDGLAVLRGATPEGMVQRANVLLAFTRDGDGFARTVFDPASATFPDGMVLSELSSLDWSEDDASIFVGVKEQQQDEPEADDDDEETANVDVWHWRDERVQSVQQVRANRDRNATYTSVVHLADGSFVQLTDEDMPSITLSEDGTFGVGRYDKPYRYDITWGGGEADSYYVDASTGERRLLVEHLGRPIGLSPDGRWYAYLQNETVYVMDIASGEVTDLTALTGVDFVDRQDDHPYEQPPYGLMGWSEDGDWIFLDHRYDLWAVPLPGSGKQPLNLTHGLGDRDAIRFRYVDLSAGGGGRGGFGGFGGGGPRTIDTSEPMLLSAYGDRSKKSGYYRVTFGEAPQPLIYADKAIGSLDKADDADRVVFTQETFTEFPDYWVADGMTAQALASARRVTDANPQQAEYAWSPGAVLIDYTDERGNELQATLSLPAGYEQGKRYPMLVYFYELMSQNHNRYSMPAYDDRPHFSTYTSNGYLVLRPDVVYTIGRPGDSAVDDLTSAVQKVIDLGYADPDHIGLQGHSWGGYQSSFVLTQTDIFAAVVTGAPVTDLISFYDELYKSSGNVQQGIMERGQVRMGVSPYEDWDLYVSQSPVHQAENITTPFLILQGTDDGSVDWHQGLEYYNAARRLGKEVIFLSYPGEGHHLSNKANQKDFQIRMKQFFDHYLMGKPAPPWMTEGVPFLEKGSGLYRQENR